MIVKTKKYKLETGTYIKLAMLNIVKEQWWVLLIAIAIACGAFFIWSWWWIIGAAIALTLYILFWLIQFAGVTQLEQNKILFERLSYEINSQQVLIKVNPKQGMPLKWEMIKKAQIGKDYFLLIVSKAQMVHLPFRIFNTENEKKFVETILKRKGYIKQ
ncbi:YcxB family protein [Catalinimonas niigatensis]|uniref:YcxB family protein n=1 Tax=Catalinimonas niigatensis TaxID=1397264 RepID=UPI0026665464|nr:YcxB family protein [Catalinimonas niigatensis]WPP49232.1 YcxB family protein [Catalinimonas niigatensis]